MHAQENGMGIQNVACNRKMGHNSIEIIMICSYMCYGISFNTTFNIMSVILVEKTNLYQVTELSFNVDRP